MASDGKPLVHRARSHYQEDNYEKAIELYRQVLNRDPEYLNRDPEYAKVHYVLGFLLKKQERYEEAETHLQKALDLNPEYVKAHDTLGTLLKEQERYEEAETHVRQALDINPEYAAAHGNLGLLLGEQERYEEAETHYRQVLDINPESAAAHGNLGNLLREQERYEEAETYVRQALDINPEYAAAHDTLGTLLKEQERYEEAETHLRQALETSNKGDPVDKETVEQKLAAIQKAKQEQNRRQRDRWQVPDEMKETYENALAIRNELDIIDTDVIEQKLAVAEKAAQRIQHQRLQDEVESLRSDFDHVDRLADEGDLEEVQDALENLEADLTSARETATQHDFSDLHDEITALERRREDRLEEITDRLETHPLPDEISRTPDISVEHGALTDREPIGGGGNADVTKATLPTPDGDVTLAIKEPRMSGTLHTDQVERMLQEAETWDKLDDHDHIVGVVDYGSEPIPWIAMEYMDGGHLGEWSGEMDSPQALWTAIATTKGVRHAHRRGVAHLDLKPKNILFRNVEDAWDVPKVADWGLSKHLLEHSKSVEGYTPTYSAPEQLEDGYGQADDITDVYQLGAVFYELFTGRPPFDGDRTGQIIRQVLTQEPTPPSEIADVPEALDDIVLTALAKEKSDRYENIILLRNDLQELFDDY